MDISKASLSNLYDLGRLGGRMRLCACAGHRNFLSLDELFRICNRKLQSLVLRAVDSLGHSKRPDNV